MATSGTSFARAIEGIPVVPNTAARDARFKNPEVDQRVENRETGYVERWDGAQWVGEREIAVRPPGNGRTVPTLTDYLANNAVFNVLDFAPPGVNIRNGTNDATSAIDKARAAAAAVGAASAYLPRGTYRYSGNGSVLALDGGVSLVGDGIGISTLILVSTGAAESPRVELTGTHQAVHGLTITESAASARAGVYGLVYVNGATDFRVEGVEAKAGASVGIMVARGATRGRVVGNVVRDNFADGIHLQRGVSDIEVSGNICRNNGDDDIALVSHGFAEDDGAGGTWGHVRDIRVTNNRVGNQNPALHLGSGIVVRGAVGVIVQDNMARAPQAAGIILSDYDGGAEGYATGGRYEVSGNEIYDTGKYASATNKEGIYLSNVNDVHVAGNKVVKSAGDGIVGANGLINVRIHDNSVRDIAARGVAALPAEQTDAKFLALWTDPLLSDGTALAYVFGHDLEITDNSIGKCGTDGLYVEGTVARSIAGLVVADNAIRDANSTNGGTGIYGLRVRYATAARVAGNHVVRSWSGNAYTPRSISNVTFLDDTTDGDIVAAGGFRQTIDGWYQDNIPASQTNVALPRLTATAYPTAFIPVRAGSVTGLCVQLSAGASGGNLTAEVAIGGVLTGVQVVLTSAGADTFKATTAVKDASAATQFAAGQRIEILVTTPAGWTGTTTDLRATVEIET